MGDSSRDRTEKIPVLIWGSGEGHTEGVAHVIHLTPRSSFVRGYRKSLKISLWVLGGLLPFAFLEPFLAMVWGSLALLGVVLFLGPFLHLKFAQERTLLEALEGHCPLCQHPQIGPYLTSHFHLPMTVQCRGCGQTFRISLP